MRESLPQIKTVVPDKPVVKRLMFQHKMNVTINYIFQDTSFMKYPVCQNIYVYIPTPPHEQDVTKANYFRWSFTGFNCFYSRLVKVKESNL